MRTMTAGTLYFTIAVISLYLGITYMFRGSFMPYHEEALGTPWSALDEATQTLLLALMDVSGAGWSTLALVVFALLLWPFRRRERWARFLLPVAIACFYIPTLGATLIVLMQTPASPPWYGNATALFAAFVAFLIDAPWSSENAAQPAES